MIPAKALQEVPTYAIEFVEQDEKTKNFWGIAFPKKLRKERAAVTHQQGRRSLSANVVGARSATYSGTVRCGLRSQAQGPETG